METNERKGVRARLSKVIFALVFAFTVSYSSMAVETAETAGAEEIIEIFIMEEETEEITETNIEIAVDLSEIDETDNEPEEEIVEEEEAELILTPVDVLYDSSVKTCMDVGTITDRTSPQWEYLISLDCIELAVDPDGVERLHVKDESGLITVEDEYIGVALGSYFGDVGSKYIFELDTGIELKVVKVEKKDDVHTYDGFIQKWDKSVIEFPCDFSKMQDKIISNEYPYNGNFNAADEFEGKIVHIWRVE